MHASLPPPPPRCRRRWARGCERVLYAREADNTKLFPSLRPGPSPLPCLRCGGAGTVGAAGPREYPLLGPGGRDGAMMGG